MESFVSLNLTNNIKKKFKQQFKKVLTAEIDVAISQSSTKYDPAFQKLIDKCLFIIKIKEKFMSAFFIKGECKIFCVNEKIHTKKEVASVE